MSHNIEMLDGKAQIAWVGQTPWHGLGKEVPADLSPRQMQKAAGLDWSVEKHPLTTTVNGKPLTVPGREALVRSSDNRVLDIVGENWIPVQNDDAFDFFNEWCEAGDMSMEVAGSLNDGKMVWVLAKVKDSFDVLKNDQVDSYLLFSNPHQYGKCIEVRFTPIRVVCNNTLTLSLQTDSRNFTKVYHRNEFNAAEVKETLGIASHQMEQYKEVSQFLANKRYTPESFVEYLNGLYPSNNAEKMKRPAQKIMDLVDQQPGADMAPGSWWNAFNAVTFYTDHVHGTSPSKRLSNAWYGTNQKLKVNALNSAVEFAEAA